MSLLKRALNVIQERVDRQTTKNSPEAQAALKELWKLYSGLLKSRGKPLLKMEVDVSRAFADVMRLGFISRGLVGINVPLSYGKATLSAMVIGVGPMIAIRLEHLPVLVLNEAIPDLNVLVGTGNLLQTPTAREIAEYKELYTEIAATIRKPRTKKQAKRRSRRPRKAEAGPQRDTKDFH